MLKLLTSDGQFWPEYETRFAELKRVMAKREKQQDEARAKCRATRKALSREIGNPSGRKVA